MWPVQYPYIVRAKNYFLVTGPVHYPYVVRTKSKILFNGPYICPYMYGPCTGHVEGRIITIYSTRHQCLDLLEYPRVNTHVLRSKVTIHSGNYSVEPFETSASKYKPHWIVYQKYQTSISQIWPFETKQYWLFYFLFMLGGISFMIYNFVRVRLLYDTPN